MSSPGNTGKIGEAWVVEDMRRHAFLILARGLRLSGTGEIDVLAARRRKLYLIEVKTRCGELGATTRRSLLPFAQQKRQERALLELDRRFGGRAYEAEYLLAFVHFKDKASRLRYFRIEGERTREVRLCRRDGLREL